VTTKNTASSTFVKAFSRPDVENSTKLFESASAEKATSAVKVDDARRVPTRTTVVNDNAIEKKIAV
jgi:hypothetical protein